ncbi:hypothetical protein H2248_007846 [Termitomyces sp. 'cryptogamus']|nr:hypothetical protein H2248_007846 [Termitomyces sp. 'cryptogamus']
MWGQRTIEAAYEVARKFMPELVAAGEKHCEDDNADSSRALQETAELHSTVKELVNTVNTLVARQEVKPTTNGETHRGPPEVQGAKIVVATGPVCKPTKASPAHPVIPAPQPQYIPRSPNPARLIVIPRGEKINADILNPRRIVSLINDRLAISPNAKHLCVASAHYNHIQNLVIMLRENQKGEEVKRHADEFIDIFGVPAHTIEMITDDR